MVSKNTKQATACTDPHCKLELDPEDVKVGICPYCGSMQNQGPPESHRLTVEMKNLKA